MSDPLILASALVLGTLLGAIFFGGLWWTVREGLTRGNPALWFFASGLARMSIAISGFYFISGGRLERLISCLLGFLSARFIVSQLTRTPEGSHASEPR